MSILAMTPPPPHPAFKNDYPWDAIRPAPRPRPHTESKGVALPSIHQTFPDLALGTHLPYKPAVSNSTNTSPNTADAPHVASPGYLHSPQKRRRSSIEHDAESTRPRQVPRLYASPELMNKSQTTPVGPSPRGMAESWPSSRQQTSPLTSSSGLPTPVEMQSRTERRPTLPPMSFDREPVPAQSSREHSWDDHTTSRVPTVRQAHASVEAVHDRPAPVYGYPYHHPNRFQSLSTSSIHPQDRMPASSSPYGSQYADVSGYGDVGNGGHVADGKQRKRRGNLPKETTDKLRAWFVAHLHHPYPTEDEKGELMRQTGLQMNQISNWFINARRRQLPAMINNARVESDAMNARAGEGKMMGTREHAEYGRDPRKPMMSSLDPESPVYEDELDSIRHRTASAYKRESV